MERLPRGRHGLSPEFVARNQRERLIAGLTEVLYSVGYQKTTVSLIGQRASVSKSDFYKHFESKDECFFAAYDAAIERIRARLVEACTERKGDAWELRVRDAVAALLALLAADPALASISLVEGLRAGRGVYDRYQAALESFVPYLREGAPKAPGGEPVPATTDEAVVGGIASLLGRRVLADEAKQLEALLPDVLEFALTPYLGVAEARRIISGG
ncbi:MAG TPA: TetR/AcrR family transcriptional regulator [Solirubrobacterales bacterium]|jgi:AcrR family transcriptional regulator|nr:TetR/AcrR family transcriptional regulator [Solirubrobacterales bacterium]